jgi:glycosyltransferase involved in cell wall biosynthesis
VPVIATTAGGILEILHPGGEELGTLVPAGDSAAIAAAVVAILDDTEGAAARAERARFEAYRLFPVARTAEVVTSVWWRALGRDR